MRSIMPTPGPLEIIIVLIIVLVIFGPKRLPDLGRSLGRGMREFKDSVTGKDKDKEQEQLDPVKTVGDSPEPPATTATTPTREQQS
jgi:sec-independent protein translocase protein TatA